MNFKIFVLLQFALLITQSSKAIDTYESPEKYMRSSLYMILIQSDEQNRLLEEEAHKVSKAVSYVRDSYAKYGRYQVKPDSSGLSVSQVPQVAFLTLPIPDQFNDFNLGNRVIHFDDIIKTLSNSEIEEGKELYKVKHKASFTNFLGKFASVMTGLPCPTNPANSKIDELGGISVEKYLQTNHIADSLVAKWFNYGKSKNIWDIDNIIERGMYDASEQEKETARKQGFESGLGQKHGLNLIPNTYVIAINLRFRSNQAIIAELEEMYDTMSKAAGGTGGSFNAIAIYAGHAAGEGYQVQAHTYLFKLNWNEDLNNRMAKEFVFANKKPTFNDLIQAGFCKMEYVGFEEASVRVRQGLLNSTPKTDLTKRATIRAIDAAIAKLQEKYDVFRTSFPISKVDEKGNVYARVGMKEGIEKGDEYEILEMQEDKTGKTIWKTVGKVKAVDKQIWDNRAEASEEFAEEVAEAQANNKKVKGDNYANLGFTTFKGAKKGQDYSGYFLRLKKKK